MRDHYLVGVSAVLLPGLEFEPALSVFRMKEVMNVHQSSGFDLPFYKCYTASKRKRQVEYTRIKQVCSFLNIEHTCFEIQTVSFQSFKDTDSLFKNSLKFRMKRGCLNR